MSISILLFLLKEHPLVFLVSRKWLWWTLSTFVCSVKSLSLLDFWMTALLGIVLLFDSYFLSIVWMSSHSLFAYKISVEQSTCTVPPPYLRGIHSKHYTITADSTKHCIYSVFSYTDSGSHIQQGYSGQRDDSCLGQGRAGQHEVSSCYSEGCAV